MLTAFLSFIHQQHLLQKEGPTLLAVSGGVDSVVMCSLFYRAKLNFTMAHCNFGLRGMASDQDEAFVQQLAQQYKVHCYTKSFDLRSYTAQHRVSTQMAARTLRYQWFTQLLEQQLFAQVATAHHCTDSVETILLNLTKGTGIAGLHGIGAKQGKVIRPLLFADKAMILQYAKDKQLVWREDRSNRTHYYQRNLLRNKVLPLLKTINPNLETTCRLTTEKLSQIEAIFNEKVAAVKEQILHQHGTDYQVAIQAVRYQSWAPVVVFEILKPFGFNFLQIKALLTKEPVSGRIAVSTSHQLSVDRTHWIITPRTSENVATTTITMLTRSLDLQPNTLYCTVLPSATYKLLPDPTIAALDLALLTFPLTVRQWQQGDFFYPLGMQQRKKVSDFLIDLKVPRPLKSRIKVVSSHGNIVWLIGYRIDDRFKITNRTNQVYEISLKIAPLR